MIGTACNLIRLFPAPVRCSTALMCSSHCCVQIWQLYVDSECPLYFASVVDVLMLVTMLSLLPLFVFMRNEFMRCRDAAVFSTVAKLGE